MWQANEPHIVDFPDQGLMNMGMPYAGIPFKMRLVIGMVYIMFTLGWPHFLCIHIYKPIFVYDD